MIRDCTCCCCCCCCFCCGLIFLTETHAQWTKIYNSELVSIINQYDFGGRKCDCLKLFCVYICTILPVDRKYLYFSSFEFSSGCFESEFYLFSRLNVCEATIPSKLKILHSNCPRPYLNPVMVVIKYFSWKIDKGHPWKKADFQFFTSFQSSKFFSTER